MKITKLLPIALAMTLCTTSVYAAELSQTEDSKTSDQLEYTLNLKDFYDIEATAVTQNSETYFGDNYSTIQIASSLDAKFNVISNKDSDDVYLYGQCKTAGGNIHALYGDAEALKIVFTRDDASSTLTEATVANLNKDADSSKNAIAFNLTQGAATATESGVIGEKAFADHYLHYPLKNGKYEFNYSISGQAVDQSFNAADAQGTYKSTLVMSRAQL